ncbi:MAG: NADP-dependent isocitrate dehydrogenase [Myxococcota bacterium]
MGRVAHEVTVIPGDGIGPEVIGAAQRVLEAARVPLLWDVQRAGAAVFREGNPTGVPAETIASIRRTRVVLKGPLETPVGFGEKSANVTLRKLFETYGNVRPVREVPGVRTPFSGRGVDLVVVRENVEDLYAGIEHQQTPNVAQCLKLISRQGCEKVARLAFEVARAEGRRSVHCATKANIMKLTEGLMKRVFEEVAREYPDIAAHHVLVDNCAHQLVRAPEQFEVIVTTNMNGDILSDLTSGLVGGLGFAPGANLGNEVAVFEAVHGTAPTIAGRGVANPTAAILSAVMMLRHLGELEAAARIETAVRSVFASGTYTADVSAEGAVSTQAFTDAVIAMLDACEPIEQRARRRLVMPRVEARRAAPARRLAGVDVFIESSEGAEVLGEQLAKLSEGLPVRLKMLSNRGTQVFPSSGAAPDCVDHWRCRFATTDDAGLTDEAVRALVSRVERHFTWMHIEKLHEFDGAAGWTRAQGEA